MEVKELFKELRTSFEEFKKANDARIEALEKKGHVDPVLEAKVEKLEKAIDEQSEALKKAQNTRPVKPGEFSDEQYEYAKSFEHWAHTGDPIEGVKAMTGATGASGGYLIPEVLEIGEVEKDDYSMLNACKVVTLTSGEYKVVNGSGIASGWVGCEDDRPATDTSVFSEITPSGGVVYANLEIANCLIEDVNFDLSAYLVGEVNEEFADEIDEKLGNGTGTKQPLGVFADVNVSAVQAAGSSVVLDDIINLMSGVKSRFRKQFVMNSATRGTIMKLKDSDGNYLISPPTRPFGPFVIWGFPVIECDGAPDATSGNKPIAFGNLKKGYTVVKKGGISVLRNPFKKSGFTVFESQQRIFGAVVNYNAIKTLELQ